MNPNIPMIQLHQSSIQGQSCFPSITQALSCTILFWNPRHQIISSIIILIWYSLLISRQHMLLNHTLHIYSISHTVLKNHSFQWPANKYTHRYPPEWITYRSHKLAKHTDRLNDRPAWRRTIISVQSWRGSALYLPALLLTFWCSQPEASLSSY